MSLTAPALLPHSASAQVVVTGSLQGIVTNKETGKPLAGVTVVVSGPALQGEQTEFTDAGGRYSITQLPVGDNYVVRFYFNDVTVERPGIRLSQNKNLTVSISMPTQKGQRNVYVIKERAPTVDTATTSVGTEINQEILQNTAVRGRTYESVLSLAPGSADVAPRGVAGGDVGVSFNGSTGNENSYIIDGLNTTDPNLGLVGTQLHQYFIKEVNVVSGGYQAEFGRATGGVVSIVTKSGSNEFHGGVFGSVEPFQLTPRTVARLGEALGTRRRQSMAYDFGFELGGPIIKDRVWFFVGFAPSFTNFQTERVVRRQTFDPMTGRAARDPDFNCPSYLAYDGYCDGPRSLALRTDEVRNTELNEYRRRYNWIAKLQFNLSPDHNIQLGYIGAPETYDGYASLRNDLSANKYIQVDQVHDVTARYVGKLLDRKLQLEVLYGYHYQSTDEKPDAIDKASITYRTRPTTSYSLSDFEDVAECKPTTMMNAAGMPVTFNPCPITAYQRGGYGLYNQTVLQRHILSASATLFVRLLGNHAWRLGFDFEDNLSDNYRAYTGTDYDPNDPFSGHRAYRTNAAGTQLQVTREFAQDKPGPGTFPCPYDNGINCLNSFRGITETRNFAVYLRDSWNVGFLPGLVINAGVRWEAQEIFGQDGSRQIFIADNWAPRIGAVYDFTRKGRSKLYFNYGRFYQSIPLDINDRQFSGEGLSSTAYSPCRNESAQPGGRQLPVPGAGPGAPCNLPGASINGGSYGEVAPGLKGQFINEIVAGFQYDVGLDIVLGAAYIHRNLGNIVEDLSTDGGNYYILANPGVPPDPGVVSDLQQKATAAEAAAKANPSDTALQDASTAAAAKLSAYKAAGTIFPSPKRDYNALQLTAQKRLSNRFSIIANYTYSRTVGNYPGTFSSSNGQLDPNISSQYDLTDLLANRNGPLPTDRPHNFKLTGFYVQPIGTKGSLTASLTFTAFSGRPIEVLGFHPYYQAREVFILPRGSGGRTPAITQFDAHLGYEHQLSKAVRMSLYADVINLFNQQEVANVDDEYTASVVAPIINGKAEDLVRLRDNTGALPVANSNYGQPTGFQQPLYMRFGARISF